MNGPGFSIQEDDGFHGDSAQLAARDAPEEFEERASQQSIGGQYRIAA